MKSRERVKKHGEVFTPPALVNEILDKLPLESWTDPTKIIGDVTGCGNGNILVEIIKRKIEHGSTPIQALSTTFGIDILRDNIQECHKRLLNQASDSSGQQPTLEWCVIVATNVVQADALSYDMEFKKRDNVDRYATALLKNVLLQSK